MDKTTGVRFSLKTIREMRGYSQSEAAKLIGISTGLSTLFWTISMRTF